MNTGSIVQVVGPVVDVIFPGTLPPISNALTVEYSVDDHPVKVTLEVQQHLGDHWVRTVSMSGTEGLKRGFEVTDSGAPISVPGEHVLQLTFTGMSLQNDVGQPTYDGPRDLKPELSVIRDAVLYDESEGVIGWYVGYDGAGCVSLVRDQEGLLLTIGQR